MESTAKAANTNQQSNIEYANVCQSLHIGFCNYYELMTDDYKSIYESHNDVQKYEDFFKNDLRYDRVNSITDKIKMNQTNLRQKIID